MQASDLSQGAGRPEAQAANDSDPDRSEHRGGLEVLESPDDIDDIDPMLLSAMMAALSEHAEAKILSPDIQLKLCQRAFAAGTYSDPTWLAQAISDLKQVEAAAKAPPVKTFVELAIPKKRTIESMEDLNQVLSQHRRWLDSVLNPDAAIVGGRANLIDQKLQGYTLAGLDLRGVRMSGAILEDIDFSATNFATADLSKAKFIRCNLRGAKFKKADLSYATFQACEVADTDFRDAVLTGSRWPETQRSDEPEAPMPA